MMQSVYSHAVKLAQELEALLTGRGQSLMLDYHKTCTDEEVWEIVRRLERDIAFLPSKESKGVSYRCIVSTPRLRFKCWECGSEVYPVFWERHQIYLLPYSCPRCSEVKTKPPKEESPPPSPRPADKV
jgi:DNA-directed RNA polymerase subunit RPC12/RpoP